MTDVYSHEIRTKVMKSVESSNNDSTEIKLIKIFKKIKLTGWRRNNSRLPGKPDFVFYKEKIAIFADGCFWHGHNCRNLKPNQNKEYWDKKIHSNKKRDKKNKKLLFILGYKVVRIWECKIQEKYILKKLGKTISDIRQNKRPTGA